MTSGFMKIFMGLLPIILISCDGQTNPKGYAVDPLEQVTKDYPDLTFIPDTAINGGLFLENEGLMSNYSRSENDFKLVEGIRSSPVVIFSTKNEKEYLLAYQYEGNSKNTFSAFEIIEAADLKDDIGAAVVPTELKEFNTGTGLRLGLTAETVRQLKGEEHKKVLESGNTLLVYAINDPKSQFLQRYNMANYHLKITINSKNKIERIYFGFDYP